MNKIYYFTGTGNSLQIASDLRDELGDAKLYKITEYEGQYINADSIGIVFPVYNWSMPLIISDFIKKLNCDNDTFIYAIANYGGLPGKALDFCKKAIEEKKLHLGAGFLINMPGNYIVGYGAKSEKQQKKLFAKEKEKIKEISLCVVNRQHRKIEIKHTFVDRLFTNYFAKDVANFHNKDKNFNISNDCIGCSLCEERCPVDNIEMCNNKPIFNHNCEFCLSCIQSCPKHAINYLDKTQNREQYINPNVKL